MTPRSRPRHDVRAALVLPLVAGTLVACENGTKDVPDGAASTALRAIGGTHDLCFETHGGRFRYTTGLDAVDNLGSGPVRVDDVRWAANDGLTMLDVRVIERDGASEFATFGTVDRYPPVRKAGPDLAPEDKAWLEAPEAVGAELVATDDPAEEHYYNFVVGLSGRSGAAGPLRIDYTDADGVPGSVDTLVTIRLKERCPSITS